MRPRRPVGNLDVGRPPPYRKRIVTETYGSVADNELIGDVGGFEEDGRSQMILIIQSVDDAEAALVALRDWSNEAPELKDLDSVRVEQFAGNVLTSLRTFRKLRTAIQGRSDPTRSGKSRGDMGSRGDERAPVDAPRRRPAHLKYGLGDDL